MSKNVHFRKKIVLTLLFAMVIGCFDPWLLKVDAAKGEHTVATDEELLYPKDEDLELNIDANPEANDPMAPEDFRDPNEFCGEPLTPEELEEMGVDFENNERNLLFSPMTYAAGGGDGYDSLRYGVDVSYWQGAMNWETAKSNGVSFAFIRAAYRANNTGALYDDPNVYAYIQDAYDAGIDVGLYCYSQAITVAEAQEEADRLVAFANSRPGRIKLPLVMDYEYGANNSGRLAAANFSKDQATDIIKAFCERVESQGYKPMVYANKSTLETRMNADQLVNAGYDVWLARYMHEDLAGGGFTSHEPIKNATTFTESAYTGDYEFWQCSSKGKGSAFGASSTYIDLDFGFFDDISTLEVDIDSKQTVGGKQYDLVIPYSWWYEAVEITITVQGRTVERIMAPTITPVGNTDNIKLKLELKEDNATQMKVKVINGYKEYLFELVYDLNHNSSDNTYSAVLNHINDYMFCLDSWPSGYEDYHATVDGDKVYEMLYYDRWDKYVLAMGKDRAEDGNPHTIVLYKTNNANRKLEKTTYTLQFDTSTHAFSVAAPVISDYSVFLTPPSETGYACDNPQIWFDGVAKNATVTNDGKWKVRLGGPDAETGQYPEIVTVYSYDDATNKTRPTGMTVYLLGFDDDYYLTELTEFKDALTYEGYSMRVSGDNGMRYRAGINTSFKNQLKTTGVNGYKLNELGIIGITSRNFATNPLIIGGTKTSTSKAYYYASAYKIKDVVFGRDDTKDYFSAFYAKMPVDVYEVPMVTRSYLKVEKAGKIYTIYSAPAQKDMYSLAKQVMAVNNGAGLYAEGTPQRAYIEKIIKDADDYRGAGQ